MTFKMSEKAQTIKIFNLRAGTNEFIGGGDAYIPPHTGLPAHCTDIAPPDIPDGNVAVFNSDKMIWSIVEDHRGQTVYDTKTGDEVYISELGPIPIDTTTAAPENGYQKWDGSAWITDVTTMYANKAEGKRQLLVEEADKITADWLIDLQLGEISDEDKASLIAWRAYSKKLKALDLRSIIDEQSFNAIEWPIKS